MRQEFLSSDDEHALTQASRSGVLLFTSITCLLCGVILWDALPFLDCSAIIVSCCCGTSFRSTRYSSFSPRSSKDAYCYSAHQHQRVLRIWRETPSRNIGLRAFSSHNNPQLSFFVYNSCVKSSRVIDAYLGLPSFASSLALCSAVKDLFNGTGRRWNRVSVHCHRVNSRSSLVSLAHSRRPRSYLRDIA